MTYITAIYSRKIREAIRVVHRPITSISTPRFIALDCSQLAASALPRASEEAIPELPLGLRTTCYRSYEPESQRPALSTDREPGAGCPDIPQAPKKSSPACPSSIELNGRAFGRANSGQ